MYQSGVHRLVLPRPVPSGNSASPLLSGIGWYEPSSAGRAPTRFGSRRSRVRIPPPRHEHPGHMALIRLHGCTKTGVGAAWVQLTPVSDPCRTAVRQRPASGSASCATRSCPLTESGLPGRTSTPSIRARRHRRCSQRRPTTAGTRARVAACGNQPRRSRRRCVLVECVAIGAARWATRFEHKVTAGPYSGGRGLDSLRGRYGAGEIDDEKYRRRRRLPSRKTEWIADPG